MRIFILSGYTTELELELGFFWSPVPTLMLTFGFQAAVPAGGYWRNNKKVNSLLVQYYVKVLFLTHLLLFTFQGPLIALHVFWSFLLAEFSVRYRRRVLTVSCMELGPSLVTFS